MILELKNIDKSFGEKEVLKGVSFTAEGGKAFGLLGRNGAGKTAEAADRPAGSARRPRTFARRKTARRM